ncbi:hypothetical protein [Diaminobutyricimonas sp. LJ205]|uniref:hypothetical protein n=1 Tax=Diaminobutyricimonas sp. LJ205 TaxID=2683590 RepID=UPI0012F4E94D|nr:hypothetical protein [Diaminobutyricimonas sp. LJ205]
MLVILVAGTLTGCTGGILPASDTRSQSSARAAVADVSRDLYRVATDTIDDYARWADAATAQSSMVELIGYEPYPDAVHGDPFGALQFRATLQLSEYGDPYVACFESEFDFWGVATEDFGDDRAVARDIQCPADAQRIAPPVDTRIVEVVPEGTEALVIEVLTNAPATMTADEIVAEVTARMPQPTGDREVPFEPAATVDGGDIGFAMGDAGDCLLVKRTSTGVNVLYVPRILLQPGELGCQAKTALLPADQLRPPH